MAIVGVRFRVQALGDGVGSNGRRESRIATNVISRLILSRASDRVGDSRLRTSSSRSRKNGHRLHSGITGPAISAKLLTARNGGCICLHQAGEFTVKDYGLPLGRPWTRLESSKRRNYYFLGEAKLEPYDRAEIAGHPSRHSN